MVEQLNPFLVLYMINKWIASLLKWGSDVTLKLQVLKARSERLNRGAVKWTSTALLSLASFTVPQWSYCCFRGFSTLTRVIWWENTDYLESLCMLITKFKRYNTSEHNVFYQQFQFPNYSSSICFEAPTHGNTGYPRAVTVYLSLFLQIFPQANTANVFLLKCTLLNKVKNELKGSCLPSC